MSGVDISKGVSLLDRIKSVSKVLAPLVLSSLERIDTISNAMVLRGFGKNKKRTWYMSRKMKVSDYLSLLIVFAILLVSILSRFVFGVKFFYPF